MTSLVAWVGADSRGPASINIAADSRISWSADSAWNTGRKVFASRRTPDIFGFSGARVEFLVTLLGQAADALDSGVAVAQSADAAARYNWFQQLAVSAYDQLPITVRGPALILYGSRDDEEMSSTFYMWTLELSPHTTPRSTSLHVPEQSSILTTEGSGSKSVDQWHTYWTRSSQGGTSRAVFSAFCDALSAGEDPRSGGAPQLVGLYRQGAGRTFGVIHETTPWYNGAPVTAFSAGANDIEWRNRLFERCDINGQRLPSAQRHYAPSGLGGHRKART